MKANELKALGEALLRAQAAALECANVNDGGSCNFDQAVLGVRLTKKQAETLPVRLEKCNYGFWKGWWFVHTPLYGQAMRRTAMAEAAAKSLSESGYDASVYYMLD